MIELRPTQIEEIETIMDMEAAADASEFLLTYNRDKHLFTMEQPANTYLSIFYDDKLAGYILLVKELDGKSIELRRIVVGPKGKGIGKTAMLEAENYAREELNGQRIWLDVFSFNARGRHVYEKLGYVQFGEQDEEGKRLLLYEKSL